MGFYICFSGWESFLSAIIAFCSNATCLKHNTVSKFLTAEGSTLHVISKSAVNNIILDSIHLHNQK